jgi:hypothetical protein
LAPIKLII